jgi:choice-of-anchor B domain-containing protein
MVRSTLGLAAAVVALVALSAPPAAAQLASNITYHSKLDQHGDYADIWGYTAPDGREYALLGAQTGLAVINITNRIAPYETEYFSGVFSIWRDIKTYGSYAYVVNESSGGLAIFDLSDPENPQAAGTYSGFSTAHNLYIEESTARCYIAGSNLSAGGVRILSLANPTAPTSLGSWEAEYAHDVVVLNNRMYASAIWAERLFVLDATNAASIATLGSIGNYPSAFTHNAWMTGDNQYVMTTDEEVGASCRMWDVSNPASIVQTDSYRPVPTAIPHNAHIRGDFAYISHYSIGVRIVDISDPHDIVEAGFYDTYAPNNGGGYDGCWGVYPFFPNSPGLMVASDITGGLYVLEFDGAVATAAPTIKPQQPRLQLGAPAPNPVRAGHVATMDLVMPARGSVHVEVHDLAGRRVATLVDREYDAGAYDLYWDGRDVAGRTVSAGVYFARLTTPFGERSRKIHVVR